MILSDFAVRRPVSAIMLVASLVVTGWFCFDRIGVDLFPRVEIPTVTVTTTLPGAGPEEIETSVTKPIEEVLNTINGIDELRSVSTEGLSRVVAIFHIERALDVAAQDVRDKVATIVAKLPEGTDPPIVDKFDIDPFRVASGYHRIAIDVMSALTGAKPATIVVNTRNCGALPDLPERSIVETSSRIERDSITPLPIAPLPDPAIGLVHGIKAYERVAIEAALTGERPTVRKALPIHPAIGEWDPTGALLADLLDPTCQHC